MQGNKILLLTIVSLMFTSLTVQAIDEILKPPQGVSIHKLDNGINVILIENPALPMVGINTVVKVGSAYETFSTSGMSHMLEHLLFNGTTQWTQKELYDRTAKIGGYNNANTGEYYTNYMMVVPSNKIETGMKIQAGMLFDSIIPANKFEKEKGIVLEEIAKELTNPRAKITRSVREKLYEGHALSLPTLGTYQTIKNLDRDAVIEFYRNNYVPNNMEISVIGNFNTKHMLKHLKEIYGTIKPGNIIRPNLQEWGTGFDQSKLSQEAGVIDYLFHQGEDTIIQSFYTLGKHSDDFYVLLVDAIEQKKENLLSEIKQRYPDQIKSISFNVHNNPVAHYLQADITLANDTEIAAISKKFTTLLEGLKLELSEEYINAKAIQAKSGFIRQSEKPHMFGIYNADMIAKRGLGSIIKAFSGAGVFQAGKELKKFKLGKQFMQLVQYPESLEKAENPEALTAKLYVNGGHNAVVIAKQNPMSDLLALHYLFKYKENHESNYGVEAAKMWHDAFGKRLKSDEVQKKLSAYGLSFKVNDLSFLPMDDIYLSPSFGYIRVEGLATDIEAVIDVLNSEMLAFVPSKKEFEKQIKITSMGGGRPKNKSKDSFKQHYEKLLVLPKNTEQPTKQLDYLSFLAFGKDYFTPNNIIVSVVSNEKPASINRYYADFKSKDHARFKGLAQQQSFKLQDSKKTINEDFSSEQAYTFYGFVKEVDAKDKVALTILSLMLKDEISFNIREKQGLAYRMSAGIKLINDTALIYVDIPTLPKNIDKLINQFPTLISPKFAKNITQEKLEITINKYLGKMMFRRLSSINQAYYLAHSYYFDGDMTTDERFLETVKQIKLTDIKKVAKKYLVNENPIQITVK